MGVWQVRGDRTGDPRPPFQVRARVDGDPQPDLCVHQMWSPTTAWIDARPPWSGSVQARMGAGRWHRRRATRAADRVRVAAKNTVPDQPTTSSTRPPSHPKTLEPT